MICAYVEICNNLNFYLFFTVGGLKSLAAVVSFLCMSESHPSTEIRDLRPSKAVTFFYIGTCLGINNNVRSIYIYFVKTSVVELLTRNIV